MLKKVMLNVAKISLAFGLIFWLVNSGEIDMQLVYQSFQKPIFALGVIAFLFFDHFIVAYRWRIILAFKTSKKINIFRVFNANWIGIFFNSVLPGSVTGDLIKIFYIEKEDPHLNKKFLLVSVLLDRVLGLCGLVMVGAISSLIFYDFLVTRSQELKLLVHLNFLIAVAIIFAFIFLYRFHSYPTSFFKWLALRLPALGNFCEKLDSLWNNLVLIKEKLSLVLFLSMVIQSLAIFIFWLVVHDLVGDSFKLYHAFSILPFGMIAMALPIAPAGLGVGHVVFLNLFSFVGIQNGASLFNVYFVYVIIVNLSGIIPYLLYRERASD